MREFFLSSTLPIPVTELDRVLDQRREPKGAGQWPGTRTVRKRSLLLSSWSHERKVSPVPGGCKLEDAVRFEPRFGFLAAWQKASYLMRLLRLHQSLRSAHGEIKGD
ncbi:hypothetical protein ACQ86G_00300 [Roseateles chitinivorans]|uniref:hypothetical protein n=1 Tax=Roseateles chitinivorans TaxID=2917965 RepID=UPI003D67CD3E